MVGGAGGLVRAVRGGRRRDRGGAQVHVRKNRLPACTVEKVEVVLGVVMQGGGGGGRRRVGGHGGRERLGGCASPCEQNCLPSLHSSKRLGIIRGGLGARGLVGAVGRGGREDRGVHKPM